MPKLLALALALILSIPACDAPVEEAEPRLVQVVIADVESVGYGRKILDACFAESHDTELRLVVQDPVGAKQEFAFTVSSSAPVEEVACAWDIVTGWSQP